MQKVSITLASLLFSMVLFAQEKTKEINVDINKNGGDGGFFASPWMWIVGGALFILLLVALTRGGGSRTTTAGGDRVTVTKTVERDSTTDL